MSWLKSLNFLFSLSLWCKLNIFEFSSVAQTKQRHVCWKRVIKHVFKYHECLSYVKCTVTYTNVSSKCKHMCSCIVFMSVFHCCILTIRFAGMGNLLKVLTREIENYPHFFLDFESKSGSGVEQREKEMDGERCWEGGREGNLLGCSLSVSRSVLSWWRCPEGVCSCSAPLHLFFFPSSFVFHPVTTFCSLSSDLA